MCFKNFTKKDFVLKIISQKNSKKNVFYKIFKINNIKVT